MSYRSYAPWSKGTGSSYIGTGGSSFMGLPKSSDTSASTTDSKISTGYSGRYGGTTSGSGTGTGTGSSTAGSSYRGTTGSAASSYRPYSSTERSTARTSDRSADRAADRSADRSAEPSKYSSSSSSYTGRSSDRSADRSADRSTDRSAEPSKYSSSYTSSKETKEPERHQSIREKYHMGPALPSSTPAATPSPTPRDTKDSDKPSIRDKYSTNKEERQSLIDKYSSGTYPGRSSETSRSYGASASLAKKEEAPSSYSKSSLTRSTSAKSDPSPEPEKTSSYSSLSPYRLYGRGTSTYSRSTSKDTEASTSTPSTAPTTPTTPSTTPTSLRFGSSRFGGGLPRSPVSEKPPTPSSLSVDKVRRPWSPRVASDEATVAVTATTMAETTQAKDPPPSDTTPNKMDTVQVAVVTRGTSPTPPSSSAFLRTRRADLARVIEKTISRPVARPEMVDKEIQSDRGGDTSRLSRFGGTSRASVSPWSSYLDRYSSTGSIGPTVSKYTTRPGGYGYTSVRSDREATVTKTSPSETTDTPTRPVTKVPEKSEELTDKKDVEVTAVGTAKKASSEPKVLERLKRTPSAAKLAKVLNENKPSSLIKDEVVVSTQKSSVLNQPSDEKDKTSVLKLNELSSSKSTKSMVESKPSANLAKSPSVSKVNEPAAIKSPSVNLKGSENSTSTVTASSESKDKTASVSATPIKSKTDVVTDILKKSPSAQKLGADQTISKPPLNSKALQESITNNDEQKTLPNKFKLKSKKEESTSPKVTTLNTNTSSKTKPESPTGCDSESDKLKSSSSKSSLSEREQPTSPPTSPPPSAKPPLAKLGSPAASRKFLPPPVPKSDSHSSLKSSSSHNSLSKGVSNKDFRKSTLNMDVAPTEAEQLQAKQEKQRLAGKLEKKTKRSPSASSDKSEGSEATESSSKVPSKTTTLRVPSPASASRSPSPSRRSASTSDDTSSSESESPSSSDEEDTPSLDLRPGRLPSSPSAADKRKSTISLHSLMAASSADESSISEKPPRPPSSPKPPPKEEAKSFLMRALAPVTNLFKAKTPESVASSCENISDTIHKTDSTPSITKSVGGDKEDGNRLGAELKNKIKVKRVESGERAWWLDSNSNIPEGIQRIQSSKSISKLALDPENKSVTSEKSKRKEGMIKRIESGDRAWWLDSNSNIPEGVTRVKSSASIKNLNESDKESNNRPDEENIRKYRIKHVESGERAWWLESNSSIPENIKKINSGHSIPEIKEPSPPAEDGLRKFPIRHQESGEKAWWLSSNSNVPEGIQKMASKTSLANVKEKKNETEALSLESSEEETDETESSEEEENNNKTTGGLPKFPLEIKLPSPTKQDEVSSGRRSPYDNVLSKTPVRHKKKRPKNRPLFISNHTNIDDILGSAAAMVNPMMSRLRDRGQTQQESGDEDEECKEVDPKQVRVHDSTAQKPIIQHIRDDPSGTKRRQSREKLDDAALQLYKDGDYGSYLDLEASINEQQEEFEGFETNRKNSIVLRTQLSVRVHTIIEKLLNSEGRELRRALFSLKQIFQEDKDLVHEFVQNDGLACLIKVGSEADQNYQNYILRALGQVMLYVDGMNGVMDHNRTVQWLYALIASKFRLVVKTALKLLLVFVEYVESNCLLLIKAVHAVDAAQGCLPWSNIMKLIKDYDAADTELLIYATTLVNKTFNGVPDQDTYYDQVDALEEQGVEGAIQRYMSKQGTDLDLLRQFQIYEAVLHHEDGEEKGTPLRQLDESIRKTLRNRKSLSESLTSERRKSRRHSTGTAPIRGQLRSPAVDDDESGSSGSRSSPGPGELPHLNGSYKDRQADDAGVTPALRRRRERAERQRSFIREQQERASLGLSPDCADDDNDKLSQRMNNGSCDSNKLSRASSRKDITITPLMNAVNKIDSADNEAEDTPEMKVLLQMKRENTVKDLTQKLANQNILHSPVEEKINRIGDMSGLISKAKEGLAKSKSKADISKSSSGDIPKLVEVKKSETELHWEELVDGMKRPLAVCDLDFTDLRSDDEVDVLSPVQVSGGIPPPPPPAPLPPPRNAPPPPPPSGRKTKKTVKLFWKEVRDDPVAVSRPHKAGLIWDELQPVPVDTQKLEHLFESRAKDLVAKKQQELNKTKEIIVLDHKRSNAINIGMTKLPPPRSIKTAILKMDATIMNREGIEKLLTMLPTEDERSRIQEAQMGNPDTPLGSAEQFLLTLTSISELPARLKLWAFKLDYENSEKEVAEPLMDLKQGIQTLRVNKTFRAILSTLLSIGIFLNGNEVKGFEIEYLAKVPEVKDTVHKHSLLHHLSHMVMEKFPDATDLYSEIGAVTRASKVDFEELAANIVKMEVECKASWDHLKLIAKHDGSTTMKVKMSDFLADCAERIIVLGIVHRRVMNRYHLFLLWLGVPLHRVQDTKPSELCRIVSEFALEYRTTRERVLQTLEKKANHRERNKTRGKMITEVGKFRTKEDRADAELRHLLGSDLSDAESVAHGTLPWRRQRKELGRTVLGSLGREEPTNGNLTDADDEILESLVKTATKAPGTRTTPRERKRTRQADRKSLKRSRTRENNVEGEGSASP